MGDFFMDYYSPEASVKVNKKLLREMGAEKALLLSYFIQRHMRCEEHGVFDWSLHINDIQKDLGYEDTILYTLINELVDEGYITYHINDTYYLVTDQPREELIDPRHDLKC